MMFKLYKKVRPKYCHSERDYWEGYIDAITPGGDIRVKLSNTYKWVTKNEIVLLEAKDNNASKVINKGGIKNFNYL